MENSKFITSWQEIHTIVDDISPDGGMSVSVFPWPDEETLRAAYEQGEISYNDYRLKLGLSLVRDQGGRL